eukprot:Skav221637  [mRNA]  locus=scaffold335:13740:26851:+ [translate_table: standard]
MNLLCIFCVAQRPVSLPLKSTALVCVDFQLLVRQERHVKDFLDVGGFGHALGNDVTKLADECLPGAAKLLDAARSLPIAAIIHTKEAHREDLSDCCEMKLSGPRCPPEDKRIGKAEMVVSQATEVLVEGMGKLLVDGSPGNDFVDAAKPLGTQSLETAEGKGAFFLTGLNEILRAKGVSHLIVCGVTTEAHGAAVSSVPPRFHPLPTSETRQVCVQTTMREANDRGYECVLVEDNLLHPCCLHIPICWAQADWAVAVCQIMETYEAAEKHLDNGDLQLSVRFAEDALSESQKAGRPPLALHLLVRAKQRLGIPAIDLVKEAAEKAKSQDIAFKAAVKLAEVSLSLGESRLSDAVEQAKDLRSLAAELPPTEPRLLTLSLSMQVTTQLARGAFDDAMRAAMELLAAAQRRQDKQAEGSAWLRIAEVHRHREMMVTGTGAGTSSAEETLQAAERSADLYAASKLSAESQSQSQQGVASAHIEAGQACLRLGRFRQSISLASEAMGIFRSLGLLHRLTKALDVELEARRALMEPMIGLQAANRELQLLREQEESKEDSDRGGRGFHQAEAEILEAIARTHGSLSEPLGAVRNALLAADLRKEIQDEALIAAVKQRDGAAAKEPFTQDIASSFLRCN